MRIRLLGIIAVVAFAQIASGQSAPQQLRPNSTGMASPPFARTDMFTGSFRHHSDDIGFIGRELDVVWERFHDTNIVYDASSELGSAWSSPYLARLIQNGSAIDYDDGAGRIDTFPSGGAGTWLVPAHLWVEFNHLAVPQEFTMRSQQEIHVFHDFTAPDAGRLKRIESLHGDVVSFNYSSGKLSSVADVFGRSLTFGHDAAGRITSVTDFIGRTVDYTYFTDDDDSLGSTGQLREVEFPEVTGTSTGNDFVGSQRKSASYTYHAAGATAHARNRLLTMTDPKGMVWLTNDFSDTAGYSFNRLVSQVEGPSESWFDYSQISQAIGTGTALHLVILNDGRGAVSEYRLNATGNPLSFREFTGFANSKAVTTATVNRPTNPIVPGAPAFYETINEYDPEGRRTKTKLPRGNSMSVTYDGSSPSRVGRMNIIAVTLADEQLGTAPDISTSWTFEPWWFETKTSTDNANRVTTNSYDYEEQIYGDLNGDQIIEQNPMGLVVRVEYPDVNLGPAAPQTGILEMFQYNEFGQIKREIDSEGRVVAYEYYPNNDPDGDGVLIAGNSDVRKGGYLKSVALDPDGLNHVTTYVYDPVGNLVGETDPNGNATSYEVNQLGQVVKITEPVLNSFVSDGGASYETIYRYDANDDVVAVWTELENSSDDTMAAVTGFSNSSHYEVEYEYDVLSQLVKVTEEAVDHPGMQASLVSEAVYDENGSVITLRYPNGDEDAWVYDERGLVREVRTGDADPAVSPSVETFTVNPNGMVSSVSMPSSGGTYLAQWSYDGFDRLDGYADATRGTAFQLTLDASSNTTQVRMRGPNGFGATVDLAVIDYRFDELDRLYEVEREVRNLATDSSISAEKMSVRYDRSDLVIEKIDARGNSTITTWDAAGRIATTADAYGNSTAYAHDAAGNLTSVTRTDLDAAGTTAATYVTTFNHDERNYLREVIDNDGNTTRFDVDSRGLFKQVVMPSGRTTGFVFDGRRRMLSSTTSGGSIAVTRSYEYDDRSRIDRRSDGQGRWTSLEWDSHDRPVRVDHPDSSSETFRWDEADNQVRHTRTDGTIVDRTFAAGIVQSVRYLDSAGAVQLEDVYTFDGLDNPVRVEEIGGSRETIEYDSRGLTLSVTQEIALASGGHHPQKKFTIDRYDVGEVRQLDMPSSRVVSYRDFAANQTLYGSTTAVRSIHTDGHDPLSNPTEWPLIAHGFQGTSIDGRVLGNGLVVSSTFDSQGRIDLVDHVGGSGSILTFDQQYDADSLRTSEIFTDGVFGFAIGRVWSLDGIGRVIGHVDGLPPVQATIDAAIADFGTVTPGSGYFYEAIGLNDANALTTLDYGPGPFTVASNVMNEVGAVGTIRTSIVHDQRGNLSSYQEGALYYRLSWNLRNQLVGIDYSGDGVNWNPGVAYGYFPGENGMRCSKLIPGNGFHEHFYGHDSDVAEIYTVVNGVENGAPSREFVYGEEGPVAMFGDVDGVATTGALGGREAFFYHRNPRGDVTAMTDASGAVAERYHFGQNGETVVYTPQYEYAGSTLPEYTFSLIGNPLQFKSMYFDFETRRLFEAGGYVDPITRSRLSRGAEDSSGNRHSVFDRHPGN